MKTMFKLIFDRKIQWRLRFFAFLNITGCLYFLVMSLLAAYLVWFQILPHFYEDNQLVMTVHKLLVLYVILGNFVLCVCTDTSVKRMHGDQGGGGTTRKPVKDIMCGDCGTMKPGRSHRCDTNVKRMHGDLGRGGTTRKPVKDILCEDCGTMKPGPSHRCDTNVKRLHGDQGGDGTTRKPVKDTLCEDCGTMKLGRSHHCDLCRTCVLKRDHHCFFMAVCIGYHNQKHFIMYCLFMFIGTFYTLVMVVKYANALYGVQFSGPQTFVTLLVDLLSNSLSGKPPSLFYLILVVLLYSSLVMGLVAVGFLYWQITIATSGQTTYEAWRGVHTYARNHAKDNLRDVFGKFWLLLFLVPLPLPQYGDGTYSTAEQARKKKA